ncbi:MAG: hypothetical protein VYA86_01110 [Candidatus Thermoplasmatota archaeon]|nr:hypothetical protein [Candidatus Thermoplasmatota archaeon]
MVASILMIPLLTAIGYDIAPSVSAQQTCDELLENGIVDTSTIENFQLTGDGMNSIDEDEDDGFRDDRRTLETEGLEWNDLCPLRNSFSTSFELYNDSAVGIRMNMVTGWKYTFSVDIQPLNDSDERPLADVYLLQENEFTTRDFWDIGMYYTWDYWTRHSDSQLRDDIATSSPNAQNMFLWGSFRDAHSYEKLDKVDFSVALDHPEQESCWVFDSCQNAEPETMFLLIDSWDNIRLYDASPQGVNYSVDVSVEVEERMSLPNWTVKCFCCSGLISILAAPFIIHRQYMKAGNASLDVASTDMMPHLETEAETPQNQ